MATGIRLEVEPWLYNILIKQQEQQRQKTGKKPSLSALILEFCTKGLSVSDHVVQNNSRSVQENNDSVQNLQGFVQDDPKKTSEMYEVNLEEISKLKESLLREQQELKDKEHSLANKERDIEERENELTEKAIKAMQEWNELLDSKEQFHQRNIEKAEQKWLIEKQKTDLTDKIETIKILKQENLQLKKDIIETLQKIDKQTEKSLLLDYIVPFLPSVISIIGFFMTNRNIDHIQELSPILAEIGNLMKELSETDKQNLAKKLEESLKAFSHKSVDNKNVNS
jgi:hypothetical protein